LRRGRSARRRARALIAASVVAAAALVAVPMVVGNASAPPGPTEGAFAYGHHGSLALVRASLARDRKTLRCARLAFKGVRGAGCASVRAFPGSKRAAGQVALDDIRATIGQWSGKFQYPPEADVTAPGHNPAIAIHQAVLPTGKVLFFSYPYTGYTVAANMASYAWLWNPALGTGPSAFTEVDPPVNPDTGLPFNLWCGGQTFLNDGRLVVVGGTYQYEHITNGVKYNHTGLNVILTFNPFTEKWAVQQSPSGNYKLMTHGRWYPTVVTLPDNRVVIMSGREDINNGTLDPDVEVFTPSANMDGTNGTVQVVASRLAQLYPHLFVLPDNTQAGAGSSPAAPRILLAGPGGGSGGEPSDSAILDTATWTFTNLPGIDRNRDYGSAVLMPGGPNGSTQVRLFGGGSSSTNTSIALDLTNPGAGWQPAAPMNVNRSHLNTVILPDGSLFTIGGGKGSVAVPEQEDPNAPYPGNVGDNYETTTTNPPQEWTSELWSPATNTWNEVATQADFRTYHSTGVLLPDATVLSAGDDRPTHQPLSARTAEIYSPPYLFKGGRPTIDRAPTAVPYGASFFVATGSQVSSAVLVKPSAVTHADDMNQRSIQLSVAPASGGVQLTSPADATRATPGYYMLFLLNAQGVPSVASFVRLDTGIAAPIYSPLAGAPAGGAGAGAVAMPGPVGKAGTQVTPKPKLKLSALKVRVLRNGLAVSFALRGDRAFAARARLLAPKKKVAANRNVRDARKPFLVKVKLMAPKRKLHGVRKLSLQVRLTGAPSTLALSRRLAVPAKIRLARR